MDTPLLRALTEQDHCLELRDPVRAQSPAGPRDRAMGLRLADREGRASGASAQAQYLFKLKAFWNQREKPNLFWAEPRTQRGAPGLKAGFVLAGWVGTKCCPWGLRARPRGRRCLGSDSVQRVDVPWDGSPGPPPLLAGPHQAESELTCWKMAFQTPFLPSRAQFCCQFSNFWCILPLSEHLQRCLA